MRRAFIVVAVIGCAVSRPNVVAGDPAVTESFDLQPYTVTGASTADLRTAIRAARPATPDGVRFDAITRWHVSYRYDFVRDATGGCADRKSTRLNSSHVAISYAVFCLKKKTL